MKKSIRKYIRMTAALLLAMLLFVGCAAAPGETAAPTETTAPAPEAQMFATVEEMNQLLKLYEGRNAYHGEFHDHADTGGKSDGHSTLPEWIEALKSCCMDFAAIVDHKQVLHMRLPEWDNSIFIGGTEAATTLKDSKAENPKPHYNMTFADPESLEAVLQAFPVYKFDGTHFVYGHFTVEEFGEVAATVRQNGGFFSIVHPKQTMKSDDPLDYWFGDYTGIEVFYQDMDSDYSQENYKLWTDLLALGKKVYATAGGDGHRLPDYFALTTIYSDKQDAKAYLDYVRSGDFICGSVGIRMAIGDTTMGGECDFTGKKVVFSIDDFHEYVYKENRTFRVDLCNENGVVYSQDINCLTPAYFAVEAEDCEFYRVEVYDYTRECRIAVGNPIWNAK